MTKLEAKDEVFRVRDDREWLDTETLTHSFLSHIAFTQAKVPGYATQHDRFMALALTVRDRLIERWIATRRAYYQKSDAKRIYYLSLEFLVGRILGNSLINLHIYDECYQAMFELGHDLEELRYLEQEAGLGNGGLGRLAACFLDSMATLELPGYGYGIRYDFGMFHQRIRNGHQIEEPDHWLRLGNPWEIARPEHTLRIQYYGRSEPYKDERGHTRWRWMDTQDVLALPYDVPIPGYRNNTVNTLRLFSAKATHEFDLDYFNHGDYGRACESKAHAENITKVLYPRDDFTQGRELRLKQEYLLVSASLQDILARFKAREDNWNLLPDRAAIQLNDTHPALAIPELMRLLVDREELDWDEAWDICVRTFAYTNHTVMPEALEQWNTTLLGNLLPRHLQIMQEINARFLGEVRRHHPEDPDLPRRVSIFEEADEQKARMAHLAILGSHSVNGVSALHTEILRQRVLCDFHALFPERFNNKTNGVTPRRWLKKANPPLAYLISDAIGAGWVTDLERLRDLAPLADDEEFRARWREVKRINKERLSAYLRRREGLRLDPAPMLDCHVKRIHDYKRQLLNILHVVTLYHRLKAGGPKEFVPRTVLLAGKAAPGYLHAKLTIKLANEVGRVINSDPELEGCLRVLFVPNYGVTLAEQIMPAAELSEQISTAGMEASGTGNMKFALNGAVTIGTLDGANVEIREEVGDDNIFVFGLTADEVQSRKANGYDPWQHYHENEELRGVLDHIASNFFSPHEPGIFQPLLDRLLREGDPYMVLADYASYVACQERVSGAYADPTAWTRASIVNTACAGRFSSDRTIRQYAEEIWRAAAVPVLL